jgi:hypothetical protein
MDFSHQFATVFIAHRVIDTRNFVADAPHQHGGMIAIALHHGVEVALPPVLENDVVIVGILAIDPAIEGFIQYQHAQSVTGIEQGGRGWIVRRPQGSETGSLEQLDLAFLGPVERTRAEDPVVVVNAAAGQLVGLAIERQPLVCRPRQRAHAELGRHFVDGLAIHDDIGDGR